VSRGATTFLSSEEEEPATHLLAEEIQELVREERRTGEQQ
jgi:hypothetical protein